MHPPAREVGIGHGKRAPVGLSPAAEGAPVWNLARVYGAGLGLASAASPNARLRKQALIGQNTGSDSPTSDSRGKRASGRSSESRSLASRIGLCRHRFGIRRRQADSGLCPGVRLRLRESVRRHIHHGGRHMPARFCFDWPPCHATRTGHRQAALADSPIPVRHSAACRKRLLHRGTSPTLPGSRRRPPRPSEFRFHVYGHHDARGSDIQQGIARLRRDIRHDSALAAMCNRRRMVRYAAAPGTHAVQGWRGLCR
ncbi:hypothetical protein BSLA_01r0770 [Burkholderia stabilis]|nr:hypothetical protein BSLA_01r0770 [Burkholderia stabilis]